MTAGERVPELLEHSIRESALTTWSEVACKALVVATAHDAVTVVGANVTLRPCAPHDKGRLVASFVDPEIHRFAISIPLPCTPQHAEQFVDELSMEVWRSGGAEFAIDLGDGRAFGGIAIRRLDRADDVVGSVATGWQHPLEVNISQHVR